MTAHNYPTPTHSNTWAWCVTGITQGVITPQAWIKETETELSDSEALTRPRRVWPDHGPLGFQGSYPNDKSINRTTAANAASGTFRVKKCVQRMSLPTGCMLTFGVTLHIILLGVGGTIYNTHTLKPFKELLGLDSQRVTKLASKLHVHCSVNFAAKLVRTSRVLSSTYYYQLSSGAGFRPSLQPS